MYYFASDIHLGAGTPDQQRRVERRFVSWLTQVGEDAEAIFLCGDIFDFWFEYGEVVPRGYVRALGKIAELTDRGVRVLFVAGNHDMWVESYFSAECGMEIYTRPTTFDLEGMRVHVAHGDNINVRGDWKLKVINKIFRSRSAYNIFSRVIHPDLMLRFGRAWSDSSRRKSYKFEGCAPEENGYIQALVDYAREMQASKRCDYYIFGHLHIPYTCNIGRASLLFMNDWSSAPQYIRLTPDGVATLEMVD